MTNHYCTYFDSGFALQGLALWRSLQRHDPEAVLWVLTLDDKCHQILDTFGEANLRALPLSALEAADAELAACRGNRSRVEYYFTLSPCLPRWLLRTRTEITRIIYLDADLFFLASPETVLRHFDQSGAAAAITPHDFPEYLRAHYERHGRFNVGFEIFSGSEAGLAILDDWRARCLEWCYDQLEELRYADQKYLDAWPERFGKQVLVLEDSGLNAAPWNWRKRKLQTCNGTLRCGDGTPLLVFHFARLRPIAGEWFWFSGQVDYGVMPFGLRNVLYGPYLGALRAAKTEFAAAGHAVDFRRRPLRVSRSLLWEIPLRVLFGADWVCLNGWLCASSGIIGRHSGRFLAILRGLLR